MAATEGGPASPPSPPSPASPASPASTRHAPSQPIGSRLAGVDPLSDKATVLLIRRTLCPSNAQSGSGAAAASAGTASSDSTPIEDLLPPLTSRNDVDLQLYALLAVVVREFVLTWYRKITPDDDQFVTELVQIVAHCTRALEQRLRKVDLESLLFDEIPQLLDNHVRAYRASRSPMVGPSIATDTRAAYHALWPLPALSPVPSLVVFAEDKQKAAEIAAEQSANEAAYRQLLVGGLLAVLLPTEDLENECLTSLVGQILSELLIGNVLASRVAEPWMMWEIVGLVSRIVREKMDGEPEPVARRQRVAVKRHETAEEAAKAATADNWLTATASRAVLSVLNAAFVLYAAVRFLVASFSLSRSLPPRGARSMGSVSHPTTADSAGSRAEKASLLTAAHEEPPVVPVLSFSVWTAVCNIVQLQVRMPWLYGTLSMLNWLVICGPGRIAALNGPLDRLLSHYIHRFALEPGLLPTLLRSIRGAVFPGNKFGATPPTLVEPANDEQYAALKRRTAEAVYAVWGRGKKEASQAVISEIEGSVLDIFDDAYCNSHLLYSIVEAVFVRLVPELAETGVLGLWEERLS